MSEQIALKSELGCIQLRHDIEWIAHANQSKWVARDPLSGSFYYFSEIEYATARLLDANTSIDSVLAALRLRFPGNNFTRNWLLSFSQRLNVAHLLSPLTPRVINLLITQQPHSTFASVLRVLAIPLSARIPLFNPTSLLRHFGWSASLIFHPVTITFTLIAAILLTSMVLAKLLETTDPLLAGLQSIQGDRWIMLLVCYAVVKSLHELGHSLACSRFQVDCQEIGLLFLFFTPCLYCDTTDSWKLSSKWRRAAIAAGGIYIELILASIAAAIWLTTQEGTLHSLATSVMLVCSVGTVLINANPFLRYDGYYILSDVWSVPNLAEQSRDAMWSLFVSALTGRRIESTHLDANIWALAAFGLASAVYRTFLGCMILWIAWTSLVPYGLGFVAVNIMLIYLFGLCLMLNRMLRSAYRDLMLHGAVRFARLVVLFTCLLVLIAFLVEVPITTYVKARAISDFQDKDPLFVPATAELVEAVGMSTKSQPNDLLIRFDAPEKRLTLNSIQCQLLAAEQKQVQLKARATSDDSVAYEIPATREIIADLRAKESLLQKELYSLTIFAKTRGSLIPANHQLANPLSIPPDDRDRRNPLEVGNIGCTLERGTLVGWFTSQQKQILTAVVAQQDVKLLFVGMEAYCLWDSQLTSIQTGEIVRISPELIEKTPSELRGDPSLVSVRNEQGHLVPELPHYEVVIALPSDSPTHLKGAVASVRFKIASRTLVESAIRSLRLSFKPVY